MSQLTSWSHLIKLPVSEISPTVYKSTQKYSWKMSKSMLKITPRIMKRNQNNFILRVIDLSTPKEKVGQPRAFDWTNYYRLADIYAWLDSLAKQYPDNVQVIIGGKSFEGRDIKGVKVSFKAGNKAIFIESGTKRHMLINELFLILLLHRNPCQGMDRFSYCHVHVEPVANQHRCNYQGSCCIL